PAVDDQGVDLWRVQVLHSAPGRPVDDVVGRVLVRPGGVETGGTRHLEDGVDPQELVGEHRMATAGVLAEGELAGIDAAAEELVGVEVPGLVVDDLGARLALAAASGGEGGRLRVRVMGGAGRGGDPPVTMEIRPGKESEGVLLRALSKVMPLRLSLARFDPG